MNVFATICHSRILITLFNHHINHKLNVSVNTAFIIIIRHELILNGPDKCDLLGYCSASSGNFLLTFRDPSHFEGSRFQKIPRMVPIDCTETSVRNCHFCLSKNTEECTKYHSTKKCTNCMSFVLNHIFKTLSLLVHVSIAYRLSSSGNTYSS